MNINARVLKENWLRKAKAQKQIISRGLRSRQYERIARAYNRTCSDVQVGIEDIPAIFRIVRVAMALTPERTDEALDRLVAAAVESTARIEEGINGEFITAAAGWISTAPPTTGINLMLSFLTWRSEIADVIFAMTKIIDHLAHAEKVGSFEMVAATIKRLGRYPRESKSNYDHTVFVMMPCPKYDFDFALMKGHDGPLSVTIIGMERYAGFSFSCALPPQTFQATLEPDEVHGISWRARKLYESIQQDQERMQSDPMYWDKFR